MASLAASHDKLEVRPVDDAEAAELLAGAPWASWRQRQAYANVAARDQGCESQYLCVARQGQILAVANIRIKRVPFLPVGVAMIAQGPVMLSRDPAGRKSVCYALAEYVGGAMGLTLRINPPIAVGEVEDALSAPFEPIPQSRYETFVIDLRTELDELRAGLNGKWRTDLRRGEKSNVRISRSSKQEDFFALQPLLEDLAHGKGFDVPQDARFFAKVAEEAREPENITIHLAHHDGRVIGGHVGAFSGDTAVYLIGATNDEGRSLRASFLLQWAAMTYAKERGMNWYDLGGADKAANPHVFRFKKRMGGIHYTGQSMVEARAAWPRGQIARLAESVYKRAAG